MIVRLAMLFTLIGAATWSCFNMQQALDGAKRAAGQLEECEGLAQQIKELRQGPQRVSSAEQSSTALAQAVEQAASTANLPREQIVHIDPQTPRRIGDTDYMQQGTHVEIRSASLAQLVAFVDAVQLTAATLAIRTPHQEVESDQELWNAEVTLTHRIYQPKSLSSSR